MNDFLLDPERILFNKSLYFRILCKCDRLQLLDLSFCDHLDDNQVSQLNVFFFISSYLPFWWYFSMCFILDYLHENFHLECGGLSYKTHIEIIQIFTFFLFVSRSPTGETGSTFKLSAVLSALMLATEIWTTREGRCLTLPSCGFRYFSFNYQIFTCRKPGRDSQKLLEIETKHNKRMYSPYSQS